MGETFVNFETSHHLRIHYSTSTQTLAKDAQTLHVHITQYASIYVPASYIYTELLSVSPCGQPIPTLDVLSDKYVLVLHNIQHTYAKPNRLLARVGPKPYQFQIRSFSTVFNTEFRTKSDALKKLSLTHLLYDPSFLTRVSVVNDYADTR